MIVDNRRFVVTSTLVSNRRPLSDEGDKIYDIVIVPPLLRSPKYKANIARL